MRVSSGLAQLACEKGMYILTAAHRTRFYGSTLEYNDRVALNNKAVS